MGKVKTNHERIQRRADYLGVSYQEAKRINGYYRPNVVTIQTLEGDTFQYEAERLTHEQKMLLLKLLNPLHSPSRPSEGEG